MLGRKKCPPICTGEPACPSELLSLDLLRPFGLEKPNGFERILAHRIGCQRAGSLLSSRKASEQLQEYRNRQRECQPQINDFHRLSRAETGCPISRRSVERGGALVTGYIFCTTTLSAELCTPPKFTFVESMVMPICHSVWPALSTRLKL